MPVTWTTSHEIKHAQIGDLGELSITRSPRGGFDAYVFGRRLPEPYGTVAEAKRDALAEARARLADAAAILASGSVVAE